MKEVEFQACNCTVEAVKAQKLLNLPSVNLSQASRGTSAPEIYWKNRLEPFLLLQAVLLHMLRSKSALIFLAGYALQRMRRLRSSWTGGEENSGRTPNNNRAAEPRFCFVTRPQKAFCRVQIEQRVTCKPKNRTEIKFKSGS